jgi:hypothetical protein
VPSLGDANFHPERLRVGAPGDNVRHAWRDLLVAAGATIGLRGRGTGHGANHPVTVRPGLDSLGGTGWRLGGFAADPARAHGGVSRAAPAAARSAVDPLSATYILCGQIGTGQATTRWRIPAEPFGIGLEPGVCGSAGVLT